MAVGIDLAARVRAPDERIVLGNAALVGETQYFADVIFEVRDCGNHVVDDKEGSLKEIRN